MCALLISSSRALPKGPLIKLSKPFGKSTASCKYLHRKTASPHTHTRCTRCTHKKRWFTGLKHCWSSLILVLRKTPGPGVYTLSKHFNKGSMQTKRNETHSFEGPGFDLYGLGIVRNVLSWILQGCCRGRKISHQATKQTGSWLFSRVQTQVRCTLAHVEILLRVWVCVLCTFVSQIHTLTQTCTETMQTSPRSLEYYDWGTLQVAQF